MIKLAPEPAPGPELPDEKLPSREIARDGRPCVVYCPALQGFVLDGEGVEWTEGSNPAPMVSRDRDERTPWYG